MCLKDAFIDVILHSKVTKSNLFPYGFCQDCFCVVRRADFRVPPTTIKFFRLSLQLSFDFGSSIDERGTIHQTHRRDISISYGPVTDCYVVHARLFMGSLSMNQFLQRNLIAATVLLLGLGVTCRGDEKLKGIACRSVHLGYSAAESTSFSVDVQVDSSAEGTYFMVCGWDSGYFGLQELADGKKLILFSVWDPNDQDDPNSVPEEKRVKTLHKDDQVRVGRFGGEGTGGQSFFDYNWKIGETYRFLVKAKKNGERSEYSGFFFVPEQNSWKHLVTFSTPNGGKLLKGHYSFVEDFRRNRVSTTKTRRAHYFNGWFQTPAGEWQPITKARFTGDANPVVNIDAGVDGDRFFLATGGEIANKNVMLGKFMSLPESAQRIPPASLPETVNKSVPK